MKTIQFILILFFLYSCGKNLKTEKKESIAASNINPSKIDSLQNNSDIQNFIRKRNNNYLKFEIKKIKDFDRGYKTDSITQKTAKKLGITKAFYKSDFDRNGYTDLLVIGNNKDGWDEDFGSFNSMVLMNFANDSIKFINILKESNTSIVPIIKKLKNEILLIINNPEK